MCVCVCVCVCVYNLYIIHGVKEEDDCRKSVEDGCFFIFMIIIFKRLTKGNQNHLEIIIECTLSRLVIKHNIFS